MSIIKSIVLKALQEQPPTAGEWGIIITLITILGSTINLLYSNRNTIVKQQQEIIASQQAKIRNLESDYQSLRNEFAITEKKRIETQGEVSVLKSKLQRERIRVKSLQKKLSRNQMKKLRKKTT